MPTESGLKLKLNKKLKIASSTSTNTRRSRNSEISSDKDRSHTRENGSKGDLRKKGRTKEARSGEVGRDGRFVEGEKTRQLNFNGRKKRVYAEEETGQNAELYNVTQASKKKVFLKKGEKKMKEGYVSEVKNNILKVKVKKERDKLPKFQRRANAKEACKELVMTDGSGASFTKKHTEQKSEFSKDKSQNVVLPSSSAKKKARAKAKVDDDVEITNEQPKKRKRVIKIDPYDISNKRLDDGIVISGIAKEKKKEPEENLVMSKNAQFRAIQPCPSILSFVENNLLGRRRSIEIRRAGYNIDLSAPLDNVPFSTSLERERIEDSIFRNKLEFFAAAKISSSFPPPNLPEIAFAGRSNVGKSSLLNALTRQWGVVRTSDKPGLTQTINFFKLGTKLCLVDLPGYGFAYAKEEVKEAWEELVKEYVSTRVGLKRVCLLIDTKWGMKPRDHELVDLMERSQTKYQVVLTKTDMVFPIDVARRAMQIEESLKENKSVVQPTMMVSSKSGAGIRTLRTVLSKIARVAKL
ncbi:LOW QUALITY PROTEIN: uncharacterized protein LOC129317671 [Prosopis cineraria]|uniref:LOW QUALITY PROTEIN: uncharacterized protein LOC129317671 n=1 Tax=Prosopis cineraria TaxID=364024 RepID=UPI00241002FC|nr:LOW QUALITY PROTEIN: uncharacterized protein LOC129317671 [Prosopis cineraria]